MKRSRSADPKFLESFTSEEAIRALIHSIRNDLADARVSLSRLNNFVFHIPNKAGEYRDLLGRLSKSIDSISATMDSVGNVYSYQDNALATVDIRSVIFDVTQVLRATLDKNRISVQVIGLASCMGIPVYLRQLFLNLFLNSIDSLSASSKRSHRIIKIYLKQSDDGKYCVIRYTDNGVVSQSLTAQEANKILFEPGYTTKKYGTGYGLFVVRKLARIHNGSIDVVDTRNGITFDLKLLSSS